MPSVAVVLGVAAALASLAIVATRGGVGVTVDSGEYLAVAESLAAGDGLTMPYVSYSEPYRVLEPTEVIPMTTFPPLAPILFAGTSRLCCGSSAPAGARAFHVLAYALLGAAIMRVAQGAGGNRLLPVAVAALLSSPDILVIHATAWSEPSMVIAGVGAILATSRLLTVRSLPWAAAAGALCAAASAARFLGLSLGFGCAAVVLVGASTRSVMERIRSALLILVPPVAFTTFWFVRSASAGSATEKAVRWHPPGTDEATNALAAIGSWFVPVGVERTRSIVGAVVVLACAALMSGASTAHRYSTSTALSFYASPRWRGSDTMKSVRSLPEATRVITNAPDAVWLDHRRSALLVPGQTNLYVGGPNARYESSVDSLLQTIKCKPGVLAFFDRPTRSRRRVPDAQLLLRLGATLKSDHDDGTVFELKPPCDASP